MLSATARDSLQTIACLHGNPIPRSAPRTRDVLRDQGALRLSLAPVRVPLRVVCIAEVVEDETALLHYLGAVGLRPRSPLVVTGRDPAQRGCTAEVQGQQAILRSALAARIWVAVQDESGHLARPRGGAEATAHDAADTDQRGRADARRPVHHHARMQQVS
jgi:Fe2+ transport system protein FeoA